MSDHSCVIDMPALNDDFGAYSPIASGHPMAHNAHLTLTPPQGVHTVKPEYAKYNEIPTYDHMPRPYYPCVSPRARSKSPPKYNGKFDFLDYQTQFECVAEDNGWDYETCGKKLSLSLTDSARSILSTLDKSVRRDYKTLCQALSSLHTTPGGVGVKRAELHSATRSDGQCPSAFGRELRRLAARAYPNEALPDAILMQLFIRGLRDSAMERHVNLQDPQTFEEAVKRACAYRAYSEPGGSRKPKPPQEAVAKVETTASLQDQISQLAANVDKLAKMVSQPTRQQGACFRCGQPGHFAKRCPTLQSPPSFPQATRRQPVNLVQMPPPGPYHGWAPPLRDVNWHVADASYGPEMHQQQNVDRVDARRQTWYPETQNSLNC
jgi:hypothetical protein